MLQKYGKLFFYVQYCTTLLGSILKFGITLNLGLFLADPQLSHSRQPNVLGNPCPPPLSPTYQFTPCPQVSSNLVGLNDRDLL